MCFRNSSASNPTSLAVPAAETDSYLNRSSPAFSSSLLWHSSWDKQRQKSRIQAGTQRGKLTAVPPRHLSATRPGPSFCPCCESADRSCRWCEASLSCPGQSAATCRYREFILYFWDLLFPQEFAVFFNLCLTEMWNYCRSKKVWNYGILAAH